jgi:hypothetical protein
MGLLLKKFCRNFTTDINRLSSDMGKNAHNARLYLFNRKIKVYHMARVLNNIINNKMWSRGNSVWPVTHVMPVRLITAV